MSDDQDHFAVVFGFDRGKHAIFEGPEESVYRWLANVEQRSMWEVWDRSMGDYETAEEFLTRLAEKYKPKPQLTEDDVRRIIDERLKEVFTFMVDASDEAIKSPASTEAEKNAFVWIQSLIGATRDEYMEGRA